MIEKEKLTKQEAEIKIEAFMEDFLPNSFFRSKKAEIQTGSVGTVFFKN